MWPVTQMVTEKALLSKAPTCRTHIEDKHKQLHHFLFLGWQRLGHWWWCTGQHSPGSQAHYIHNQALLHHFYLFLLFCLPIILPLHTASLVGTVPPNSPGPLDLHLITCKVPGCLFLEGPSISTTDATYCYQLVSLTRFVLVTTSLTMCQPSLSVLYSTFDQITSEQQRLLLHIFTETFAK